MMNCPECQSAAHTRSSRMVTEQTKERHHQCRNLECSCTFVTHESYARIVAKPQKVTDSSSRK